MTRHYYLVAMDKSSLTIEDALKSHFASEKGYGLHMERADQYATAPKLPEELLQGVLRKGHKLLLAGPSDSGKTSLLLSLALACTQGKPWLDLATQKSHVLYVNLEIESTSFIKRIHDVAAAYSLEAASKRFHFINHRGGNLDPTQFCKELRQMIVASKLEGQEIKLVIIDPVYKLIGTGGADETSNQRASRLISGLGDIAEVGDISFAIAVDVPIDSPRFQVTHEIENGVGQLARDADSLLTLWPLEWHENAYRLKGLLREFEAFKPMSLAFEYPQFTHQEDLDRIPILGAILSSSSEESLPTAELNLWKVWDSIGASIVNLDDFAKALGISTFETRQKVMQLGLHPQRANLRLRMTMGNKIKAEEQ